MTGTDERPAGAGKGAVVIGAGVVGVATALYLQRDGWQVTVIDPHPPGEAGASFGNAGLIATHSVLPLALGSILRKIPGMLADETAPLAIRWQYFPLIAPWLLRLLWATRPGEVERITAALASELRHAEAAYAPLLAEAEAEGFIRRKGCLTVYPDEASLAEHARAFDLVARNGVTSELLGHNEIRNLVPGLGPRYRFGQFYPDVSHVADPFALVGALARDVERRGGRLARSRATGFRTKDRHVTGVRVEDGVEEADLVVVAAGAWSKPLARQLGSRVPLDTERGYHVTLAEPGIDVEVPMMVGDTRFAITPMQAGLRLAGTVEFGGMRAPPNPKRHDALIANARHVLPDLRVEAQTRWMGFRPSMPDSKPVIGPSPHYGNVFFGFGHGHLGLTSAAITGQTIAALAAGRAPLFDPAPFAIGRF